MQRRTALEAIGASALGGLMASGAVSANDGGPVLVDFEQDVAVDFLTDVGEGYRVKYEDDGSTIVTGGVVYGSDCPTEIRFEGFEKTDFGDVAVIEFIRDTSVVCPDVVTPVTYRATIEYPEETGDLFVKHIGDTG